MSDVILENGWLAKRVKESKRNVELRDPYRTLQLERELAEAEAKLAKVRELLEEIKALGDGAYCRALDIARKPEALGWEIKVQRGEFGRKELQAHCESERQIGKHQGYADARNKLTAILEERTS